MATLRTVEFLIFEQQPGGSRGKAAGCPHLPAHQPGCWGPIRWHAGGLLAAWSLSCMTWPPARNDLVRPVCGLARPQAGQVLPDSTLCIWATLSLPYAYFPLPYNSTPGDCASLPCIFSSVKFDVLKSCNQ
jgi:hypothetical protein